jgi:hypothetical protein
MFSDISSSPSNVSIRHNTEKHGRKREGNREIKKSEKETKNGRNEKKNAKRIERQTNGREKIIHTLKNTKKKEERNRNEETNTKGITVPVLQHKQ